jgi:hypothetical protein
MRCNKVQKMLTGFLDGEVSPKNASLIRQHLTHCEECSRHVAEARKVMKWAGTWQEVEPSPVFLMRLKARIRSEAEPKTPAVSLWLPGMRRAFAGVAAACIIFLGGYFAAVQVLGGRGDPQPRRRVAKLDSAQVRRTPAVADREEAERLVLGVQKMKIVFGEKLTDSAYAQLNEIQKSLAVRGGMSSEELAAVEDLQKAELLIREGDYAAARQLIDEAERDHPDHPLAPYVRIAKVMAAPQPATGSDFLKRAYATLLQETVGDPIALYEEVTNIPGQVAQLREYGWERIVKSADRLNPLNAWNFVERRILGDEAANE